MISLRAEAAARGAAAWLRSGRAGRVLHVFDRTINLIDSAGEVLSLAASRRGLGPFSVVVQPSGFRFQTAEVVETSAVLVAPHGLQIGSLRVEIPAEMEIWDARPDWEGLGRALADTPGRAELLARAVAPLLERSGLTGPGIAAEAGARRRAALRLAWQAGDFPAMTAAAQRLIGLGPGVTPAGDDYLVGAGYGLRLRRLLRGADPASAAAAGADLLRALDLSATSALSAAFLRAAARGEALIAWHGLVAAVIHDPEQVAAAAAEIAAVGHTSGADALLGFWEFGLEGAAD